MSEMGLKELSDRAPQGEWTLEEMPNDAGSRSNAFTSFGVEADGKTLLDTLNATGMYLEQEPDGDGGYDVWDAQGKAVVEYVLGLVRNHRAGRLHDDTALADAVARARREALEEAAKVAESVRDNLFPVLNKSRYQPHEVTRFHKHSVGLVVEDIRALVANTPEPAKETGWRPIEEAPKDGSAFLGFLPQFGGYFADQRIQRCQWTGWGGGCWECQFEKGGAGPTHWMPLPTPPAIEALVREEGRHG